MRVALRLTRFTLLLALLPAAYAVAESAQERQAREDLERQLKAMVGTPPTKVLVEVEGLDEPNYELIEASFRLDGRNLPAPDLKKLNGAGTHLIFHGDVEPGPHRLESVLEFRNKTTQVVSSEGGYKWKPGSDVAFKSESGIEVQIKVTPELHPKSDLKDRISVKSPATVKMLAKLDDGSMPDPVVRPKVVAGTDVPDAGGIVVKGESAADKAAAAAEAKKKAAEDARAAKQAAADEKKAAQLAAAEERKRKADEAAAAKQAAADEKKRAAAEKAAGNKVATNDAPPPTNDSARPLVAVMDAGAVALEEVDAGPAVAAAPEPVKAAPPPVPVAPVEESFGIGTIACIGIGVAVLVLLLFLVARRKKDKKE